jgi:hypothetical protein
MEIPRVPVVHGECPNLPVLGTTCWCERGDSNPHALRRQILSLVRLPIPPLSHWAVLYCKRGEPSSAKARRSLQGSLASPPCLGALTNGGRVPFPYTSQAAVPRERHGLQGKERGFPPHRVPVSASPGQL